MSLLGGHDHPGRTQDRAVEAVAPLVDLGHGARLGPLHGHLAHRLVLVGVEPLSLGGEALDARARERLVQLLVHELHALGDLVVLGRGLQGQLEVVQRGEQLLGQAADAAQLGSAHLGAHALAEVLEVGLRALGQREVLVPFALGTREELVEVGRDGLLGGVRAHLRRRRGLLHRRGDRSLGLARRDGAMRLGLLHQDLPSSTTSASTTSSSASEAAPSAEPLPCAPAAACCSAWARSYIASETLWKDACSACVRLRMFSTSSDSRASRTAVMACSMSDLEASSTLSPRSLSWRSAW